MTVNRGHTERAENEKEKLSIFNYKGQCSGVPLRELRVEGDFTPSVLNWILVTWRLADNYYFTAYFMWFGKLYFTIKINTKNLK